MDSFDAEIISLLDNRKVELRRILGDLGTTVRLTHNQLDDVDKLLRYLGAFLADADKTYVAPYFVFNLVANLENPGCEYDPSSRPHHAVTDQTVDEPAHEFACTGITTSTSSNPIAGLPPALQAELRRVSWLQLFTLGY
jgi:hypothetical protein